MALTLAKKIDKQPPQIVAYSWEETLVEERKHKLTDMEANFTFRSFNYIWDWENHLYYPYYEYELSKRYNSEKPQGITQKQFM